MVNSNKHLQEISGILRRDSLQSTTLAGSGHPTSCLSCAELMSCLFFNEMSYDPKNPENKDNDEFVLSKGHAAPIYYSALKHAGCINHDIMQLRKSSSPLEGHPIPSADMPWIKIAAGSLGQGLSVAAGMALASKLQRRNFRVYTLLGDSECAEGSVWEAAQIASHYKLSNLCAIIDINRLGQRGETMLAHNLEVYKKRFESFGWQAIPINGHKIPEILTALKKSRASKKPTAILAKTIKGKGISFLENQEGWHGRSLTKEELAKALKELPTSKMPQIEIKKPTPIILTKQEEIEPRVSSYNKNDLVSTREAYGRALAKLGADNPNVLALDAEVSNSTYAEKIKERVPEQFVECFIAEQNMISLALGLSKKGFKVFASTFAAFLTRAHDQLRMSALSQPSIVVCGSHSGVSIGEDGTSQMGLEDIAMFRSLPNTIILYPSDAQSAEALVNSAFAQDKMTYIRTTRPKTPIIYAPKEDFPINNFKIVHQSPHDSLTLVGAGITLHESIKAQEILKQQGLSAAVIDCYCIQPFPTAQFIDFIKKHGSKIVIAEDHYAQGGIGEMLSAACINSNIQIKHLAIRKIPHSATKEQLLERHGINAAAIVKASREMI